jgi:transposase
VRDQPFLLPPDMREWLPEDHPVWLVIRVVEEHLDTSAFHALRKAGGAGTAGYDPDMLLTVLIWAYAHGVHSSRRMEQLCGTDVAFRVICGGNRPDHVTLARFRAAFPGAAADLFAEVLRLCARLGMGKLGVVALDGTKVTANASKSANRTGDTLDRLAAETVAAHAAADAGEDVLFGDAAGDEVPEQAWSPKRRDERIRAAAAGLRRDREQAEREERAKADRFRERREAGERTGPAPVPAEVELAEENLARVRAARQARLADLAGRYPDGQSWRAGQAGVDDYCRVREAAAKVAKARERAAARGQAAQDKKDKGEDREPARNITDPDSRLMPVRGGFEQAYNAQNVTSEDGLVIATELTDDPTDTRWFEPMMDQAAQAAALITENQPAQDQAAVPAQDQPAQDQPAQDEAARDQAAVPAQDQPAQDQPAQDQPAQDQPAQDEAARDQAAVPAQDQPAVPAQDQAAVPGTIARTGSYPPGSLGAWLIALALADAGYLSVHNLTCPGPARLIATGKLRDLEKTARGTAGDTTGSGAGDGDGPVAAMRATLATEDGITAYRQRGHIAETPHGNIKHNLGFRQFTMRGKAKAAAEWKFLCAIHNLGKALSSGRLTAAALAALPAR